MGSRKTLILVAAIAIGAIGAFILFGWLSGVQNRADNNAVTVDAWVVKSQVEPGSYGEEAAAFIKKEKIPRKIVPGNAVHDLTQIQGKVTATKLVPNQVVTTDMFVSPASAQASFSDRLGKEDGADMVSFTMNLDPTHAVAGLLSPGDYVNIMTLKVGEIGGGGGSSDNAAPSTDVLFGTQARYIYLKSQIVAIDQRPKLNAGEQNPNQPTGTDPQATTTAPPANASQGLITLRVPTRVAQVLASLPPENVYLSLVGKGYKPEPQSSIDPASPLPAEDPSVLTPYGPDGAKSDK